MIAKLYENAGLLVLLTSIIITLIILAQFSKLSKVLQVFSVFFIVSTCTELLSYVLAMNGINNVVFSHIYTLVGFWFMTIFFQQCALKYNRRFNATLILTIGSIIIICNSLFIQPYNTFNSYSAPLVSLFVLLGCFYVLNVFLDQHESQELKILKIIVICQLLTFGITLIVLLFSNEMLHIDNDKQIIIWLLRSIINMLSNFIILGTFVNLIFHPLQKTIRDE